MTTVKRSKSERRLLVLFYLLTGYILLQFAWWAYLLIDLSKKYYAPEGAEVLKLKVWMVVGEGSVFLLFLLAGLYIMQRTIRKDIVLMRQQRNFLLSITHELKTPIAAIKLCLQTLQKRSKLNEAQREPLQKSAIDNTERLHKLIDNVLLATRIDSQEIPVGEGPTEISSLTESICTDLAKTVASDTEIRSSVSPGLHARIDEQSYSSILINLVENAAKYAGGETVQVSLMPDKEGSYLLLSVSDSGPGIPSSERLHIFKKFYRMGNEETRSQKGTGLGLYIVSELLRMAGGKISINDNEPRGSTFLCKIPTYNKNTKH